MTQLFVSGPLTTETSPRQPTPRRLALLEAFTSFQNGDESAPNYLLGVPIYPGTDGYTFGRLEQDYRDFKALFAREHPGFTPDLIGIEIDVAKSVPLLAGPELKQAVEQLAVDRAAQDMPGTVTYYDLDMMLCGDTVRLRLAYRPALQGPEFFVFGMPGAFGDGLWFTSDLRRLFAA